MKINKQTKSDKNGDRNIQQCILSQSQRINFYQNNSRQIPLCNYSFQKITLTALLTLHKNKRDRVKNGKRLIKRNHNYAK